MLPRPIEKILLNSVHIAVVGRTGSGKSNLIKLIAAHLVKMNENVILVDFHGEHRSLPIEIVKPKFGFRQIKKILPFIVANTLRPKSGGFGISIAVRKALVNANSWADLVAQLEKMSTFERDIGAKAALMRLLPLYDNNVLADESLIPKQCIINLGEFDPETQVIVQSFLVALLYTIKFCGYIIFEEVGVLREFNDPILFRALLQLRKFGSKIILTDQELIRKYLQYNLVIFDIGLQGFNHVLNGVAAKILKLRVGEAVVYDVEEHSWKKVRVPLFEDVR